MFWSMVPILQCDCESIWLCNVLPFLKTIQNFLTQTVVQSCNARHLCSECIPNTGNLQSPPRPQTNLCVRESLWNWTGSCKQQGRLSICHEKCPHLSLVMMQSFCVLAQYENLLRLISRVWWKKYKWNFGTICFDKCFFRYWNNYIDLT